MDPVFGLPCTSDSRAMELARNRNHIADKKLVRKFEALDLAQRTKSGKYLTRRNDAHEFLTSIEINQSAADKAVGKKTGTSMSLKELDKRLHEVKGLKVATDALARSRFPHADDPKVKTSSLYKENTTVSLVGAFDDEGRHIVDLDFHDQLLTINRKKHAMREAWDRATSADVQYRSSRLQANQSQSSPHARKAKSQERLIDSGRTSRKLDNKSGHNEHVVKH